MIGNSKLIILILNSIEKECGIHQYGLNIYHALSSNSKIAHYIYSECESFEHFICLLNSIHPDVVILNSLWLKHKPLYRLLTTPKKTLFVDILHEEIDYDTKSCFNTHFVANCKLDNLKTKENYKPLPRIVPRYPIAKYKELDIPKVGCYNFGSLDRGWLQVINTVQRDYERAILDFNMPFSRLLDPNGKRFALKTAEACYNAVYKSGITLQINHEFLTVTP